MSLKSAFERRENVLRSCSPLSNRRLYISYPYYRSRSRFRSPVNARSSSSRSCLRRVLKAAARGQNWPFLNKTLSKFKLMSSKRSSLMAYETIRAAVQEKSTATTIIPMTHLLYNKLMFVFVISMFI